MNPDLQRFEPPRRTGLLLQGGTALLLAVLSFLLFSQALLAELGPLFLLYLIGAVALASPLPVLIYRIYSLARSHYTIARDGLQLQWGLRAEDIPMGDVLWVRYLGDQPLALPRLHWPGALVGKKQQAEIGTVEFMAAHSEDLVLVATPKMVYAISPEDYRGFLETFRRQIEMGSLAGMRTYSAQPTFLLSDIWEAPVARIFLVVDLALALALFVLVGFTIPRVPGVSLGFSPTGAPLSPVPSVQLLLLPALNIFLGVGAYALSMVFHHRQPDHPLAYVLWISTTFTAVLMLAAVLVILANS